MKCATCVNVVAGIALAGMLWLPCAGVSAENGAEPLARLQDRIIAAAGKAMPSVVRVVWRHDDEDDSASGVIFTADGYVATYLYKSRHVAQTDPLAYVPPGQSVSVHLADGRSVPGVAVGSYLSGRDRGFSLVKITGDGVWPCAETGRAEDIKAGDTCLALGFPPGPDGSYQQEPSVRVAHMIPWVAPAAPRSSCVLEYGDERGGGLFDLNGRLIGIHLCQHFSDYRTWSDPTPSHLDIKVVQENWRQLVKAPSAATPARNQSPADRMPLEDESLPTLPLPDDPELAAASAKVREATVAIVLREPPNGCSGTIVTPDGYIATCAHHRLARGTDTSVYLPDGRTAPARILGRDDDLDVGLVKITAPGPWPFVSLGKSAEMKAGDSCIAAGYPNYLRKGGKVPLVVRGARIADTHYAPVELVSSCRTWNGDSGGGLFDPKGRLMGVLSGPADSGKGYAYAGADAFTALWPLLVNGPALADFVPFDASPAAAAVRKAIQGVPPIVCEVLGDGKRRALGTIVSPNGLVLTKASELRGELSCRLADGRVVRAAAGNVARDHDLAVLKIDATDLPQIEWRERQELPVGTLVAALCIGGPPTVGIVSHATHKVSPAKGCLGIAAPSWSRVDKTSLRKCPFPAVFETDVRLRRDTCGGPLVDCEGRVVGITIAVPVSVLPGSTVMARAFVVPAAIARTLERKGDTSNFQGCERRIIGVIPFSPPGSLTPPAAVGTVTVRDASWPTAPGPSRLEGGERRNECGLA